MSVAVYQVWIHRSYSRVPLCPCIYTEKLSVCVYILMYTPAKFVYTIMPVTMQLSCFYSPMALPVNFFGLPCNDSINKGFGCPCSRRRKMYIMHTSIYIGH